MSNLAAQAQLNAIYNALHAGIASGSGMGTAGRSSSAEEELIKQLTSMNLGAPPAYDLYGGVPLIRANSNSYPGSLLGHQQPQESSPLVSALHLTPI
jgi:hypothetical protein